MVTSPRPFAFLQWSKIGLQRTPQTQPSQAACVGTRLQLADGSARLATGLYPPVSLVESHPPLCHTPIPRKPRPKRASRMHWLEEERVRRGIWFRLPYGSLVLSIILSVGMFQRVGRR